MADLKKLLKKQMKQRDKNIALIESEVLRVLEKATFQIYKDIDFEATLEASIDSYNVIYNLPNALREAGLEDVYNKIQDGYADELEIIEATLLASSLPPLSNIDRQAIAVIIETDFEALQAKFNNYTGVLSQDLARSVLTGQAPDFEVLTANLNKRTVHNIKTEFDTALSGLDSAINIKKAKEVDDNPKFIYLGANDGKTRDFCRSIINEVLTIKEIEKLDNGQGLPVLEYGGGYNCRHQWRFYGGS